MPLLITIVAVGLGVVYAGLVNRRFGAQSWTAWLLVLPVVIAYAVVLLTADMTQPVPRAVQSFAIGALIQTGVATVRADLERRRRVNAAEATDRARVEAEVRAKNAEAARELL
jgi:uncharacterized membrane protein YoaK (UPF0700 family)